MASLCLSLPNFRRQKQALFQAFRTLTRSSPRLMPIFRFSLISSRSDFTKFLCTYYHLSRSGLFLINITCMAVCCLIEYHPFIFGVRSVSLSLLFCFSPLSFCFPLSQLFDEKIKDCKEDESRRVRQQLLSPPLTFYFHSPPLKPHSDWFYKWKLYQSNCHQSKFSSPILVIRPCDWAHCVCSQPSERSTCFCNQKWSKAQRS